MGAPSSFRSAGTPSFHSFKLHRLVVHFSPFQLQPDLFFFLSATSSAQNEAEAPSPLVFLWSCYLFDAIEVTSCAEALRWISSFGGRLVAFGFSTRSKPAALSTVSAQNDYHSISPPILIGGLVQRRLISSSRDYRPKDRFVP